jgi:hypothetical protein
MFEWCSSSDATISSPARSRDRPHELATRLIASVVPRTKTISRGDGALMNRWTVARAASYSAVAR